jgi:hypothetical protein
MQVSARIAQFIQGPTFGLVATRNAKLRPHIGRAFGAFVVPPGNAVTFYLPQAESEQTLDNLNRTGNVAATFADAPTLECYQLKGRFKGVQPATPADEARQDAYLAALAARVIKFYEPVYVKGFRHRPFLSVTFEVDSMFDQTPGPKAGAEIVE